jgi:hypothetical protein
MEDIELDFTMKRTCHKIGPQLPKVRVELYSSLYGLQALERSREPEIAEMEMGLPVSSEGTVDGILILEMGKYPNLVESCQLLNDIPPENEFPSPKLLRRSSGGASKRGCQNLKSFHGTRISLRKAGAGARSLILPRGA